MWSCAIWDASSVPRRGKEDASQIAQPMTLGSPKGIGGSETSEE